MFGKSNFGNHIPGYFNCVVQNSRQLRNREYLELRRKAALAQHGHGDLLAHLNFIGVSDAACLGNVGVVIG
jgi:hypothetical protein